MRRSRRTKNDGNFEELRPLCIVGTAGRDCCKPERLVCNDGKVAIEVSIISVLSRYPITVMRKTGHSVGQHLETACCANLMESDSLIRKVGRFSAERASVNVNCTFSAWYMPCFRDDCTLVTAAHLRSKCSTFHAHHLAHACARLLQAWVCLSLSHQCYNAAARRRQTLPRSQERLGGMSHAPEVGLRGCSNAVKVSLAKL